MKTHQQAPGPFAYAAAAVIMGVVILAVILFFRSAPSTEEIQEIWRQEVRTNNALDAEMGRRSKKTEAAHKKGSARK